MDFFSDWTWWGFLACSVAASVSLVFFQKIRLSLLFAIALFCLTLVVGMYARTGVISAVVGLVITLFSGLGALLFSLILSGIQEMLKKRYR